MVEVAEKYGVARELVRQVATKNGYKSAPKPEPVCSSCNGPFEKNKSKAWAVVRRTGRLLCRKCGVIDAACDTCGSLFKIAAALLIARWNYNEHRAAKGLPLYTGKHLFCSNTCKGKHLGAAYGFGSPGHPSTKHY